MYKKKGDEIIEKVPARQCYYCHKYSTNLSKFIAHLKCCSDIAGIAYTFEHKNIISFQDNFKYLGDLAFVVYFDYETTTRDNVF